LKEAASTAPRGARRGGSKRAGRWTTVAAAVFAASASLTLQGADRAFAKDEGQDAAQQEEEIDYVSLASRMIKDGHFDRARTLLEQVDVEKPGIELPRFYTLQGLVRLQEKRYKDARKSLQNAIAAGQDEPLVFLYLAQAHFGLKDYKGVIGALGKAGDAGKDTPATFLMRSQAHWELKQQAEAIAALNEGKRRLPKETDFTRTKIFYLIDLGLFQEVAKVGEKYLSRTDATAEDYAAVGEGLRRSKQFKKARDVLEAAHLRFPSDEKTLVLLAHTYLDDDHPLTAAMLFEDASRVNPKYALEEPSSISGRAGKSGRCR
jgi:tetratricopeptide (TPR) repeat protein